MKPTKGEWINAYHFWLTERGEPVKVKPIRHIGFKGWDNYIFKKEYQGVLYCGDCWLCEDIFGVRNEYTFRTIYSTDMEEIKKNQVFKTYHNITDLVEINAHFDGYDAYITNDLNKRSKLLLKIQNDKLNVKIEYLTTWFKELNNLENPLLKLGIQLYLRRLQTPTMQTSREWKEYRNKQPYLTSQIISKLKEIGVMT